MEEGNVNERGSSRYQVLVERDEAVWLQVERRDVMEYNPIK